MFTQLSSTRIGLGLLTLAVAGLAHGQSAAPATPEPPAAPKAERAPRAAIFARAAQPTVNVSSTWTVTTEDNGKTVTVTGKGDEITAQIDGKDVPKDRIRRVGNRVIVTDDKGDVVFDQFTMGGTPLATAIAPMSPFGQAWGRGGASAWGLPNMQTMPMDAELPKVMVGVQLTEPDASLLGHFGLREGESTLIAAVYEGLPAAVAGLKPYDIIVSVNGKSPAGPEAVREALRDTDAGKSVSLEIIHRGERKTVSVTPEKYDREKLDKARIAAVEAGRGVEGLTTSPNVNVFSGPGRVIVGSTGGQKDPMVFYGGEQFIELQKRLEELAAVQSQKAGQFTSEMDRQMTERMRKLEEMIKTMMEQRQAVPTPPPAAAPAPGQPGAPQGGSSRLPMPDVSSRSV